MSTAENRGQKRPPPSGVDDNGGGKKRAVATASSDDDEEDVCWLCLDGEDESGEPLRRDCSCRGGSGWAHLPCIVEYAKQKNEQWDGRDINKFREPWKECPSCHQSYQNEIALELANEFVPFVEGKYPDDQVRYLAALDLRALLPKQKEEKQQIVNKIISIIEEMKTSDLSLPGDVQMIEARAYNNLGHFAFKEGTKESAKTAIEYFEKYRDICEEADYAEGVTIAESNLAQAKSKYEGRNSTSHMEIVEKYRKAYMQFAKHGQEEVITINTGVSLATALKNAHHGIEAERLLTKLVTISKRIHGPEHQITKHAKSTVQKIQVRKVKIKSQYGKNYQALRHEEDGGKYVVQGPITNPRNVQAEETLTVDAADIIFFLGTPVVCHGLKELSHLNDKIGDLQSLDEASGLFVVHFEDKDLEPRPMKQEFMRILFDLPEEES